MYATNKTDQRCKLYKMLSKFAAHIKLHEQAEGACLTLGKNSVILVCLLFFFYVACPAIQ